MFVVFSIKMDFFYYSRKRNAYDKTYLINISTGNLNNQFYSLHIYLPLIIHDLQSSLTILAVLSFCSHYNKRYAKNVNNEAWLSQSNKWEAFDDGGSGLFCHRNQISICISIISTIKYFFLLVSCACMGFCIIFWLWNGIDRN